MIAIGIGSKIDNSELQVIASGDGNDNVFMVDDFNALQSVQGLVIKKACEGEYHKRFQRFL